MSAVNYSCGFLYVTRFLVASRIITENNLLSYASFHIMFFTLASHVSRNIKKGRKNAGSTCCRHANSFPVQALSSEHACRSASPLNSRGNVPKIIPDAKRVVIKIPSSLLASTIENFVFFWRFSPSYLHSRVTVTIMFPSLYVKHTVLPRRLS